jgi:hypothetical protein
VLIDHQPAITMIAPSLRPEVLVNNVAGLAAAAKALRVPMVAPKRPRGDRGDWPEEADHGWRRDGGLCGSIRIVGAQGGL